MLRITPIVILALNMFCMACSNQTPESTGQRIQPIRLTNAQLTAQERLKDKIANLSVTKLSATETEEIVNDIAKISATNPEQLLPLLSYYEFYSSSYGTHLNHPNWYTLELYKGQEIKGEFYHEATFKFYSINRNTMFCWYLAINDRNGVPRKDRIGGRMSILSTQLGCVKGLSAKFYLENGNEIFYEIDNDLNCDKAKFFGASLDYEILEQLSQSQLRAFEIRDEKTNEQLTFEVTNHHMKGYFKSYKEQLDNL